MKCIQKILFMMLFCSLSGYIAIGSEDYQVYRQSVIQNIFEKTDDPYDDFRSVFLSLFDEHSNLLQILFARQTDSEFLPYIQRYESIKGDVLRSDIKILFSDHLQEAVIADYGIEDLTTEYQKKQEEELREKQRDQQIIGSDYDFDKIKLSGSCLLGHLVFMDRDVWEILSEIEKEIILFHELGHCDLYRNHLVNEPSIMSVNMTDWLFVIMRNPNLNLQRNDNYIGYLSHGSPMCLCNESGVCSNNYCLTEWYKSPDVYQRLIDITKSRNFEPLYQELFSIRPYYTINFQTKDWAFDSRILKEIAQEPRFQ